MARGTPALEVGLGSQLARMSHRLIQRSTAVDSVQSCCARMCWPVLRTVMDQLQQDFDRLSCIWKDDNCVIVTYCHGPTIDLLFKRRRACCM